jgi:hypothetical protein
MVSHCANPACDVPLRYLRDGRLYQFEVRCTNSDGFRLTDPALGKSTRHVSHYWLCGQCSALLTLHFDPTSGVIPVAVERASAARAASAA